MSGFVLVRHGETEWSLSGQHTSTTDLGLTEHGRAQASSLASLLANRSFADVVTSPRKRALATCAVAGFDEVARVDNDAVEWDYGTYEGRTTAEIRVDDPDWSLWTDGVPGGESGADVAARADRIIERARSVDGVTLLFSHGHFLRVLAARWLGLDARAGAYFLLGASSLSELGWEREQRVVTSWNNTRAI